MAITRKVDWVKLNSYFPAFEKIDFDSMLAQIEEQLDASIKVTVVSEIEELNDVGTISSYSDAEAEVQLVIDKVNELLVALQGS
jgi:hypothetical protein